jgi:FAD/FMN-containing dehydrogenase
MGANDRRQFLRHSLLALPAAAFPFGSLFAGADASIANDVEAVTGDGKQVLLKAADVRDFAAGLRGELLVRDSAGYDSARRVWNGAFDRHPAMIARCTGAADVMRAVGFAASNHLLLSVRGGGHSLSGQSVCDKGLMIDLSQMDGVRIDPARRIATVEGGALLGALDRESLAQGLATTAGTVSHTGVGGLTLGGGFGRLGRKFGLTCDNVRAVDLVSAGGKFLTASSQQNKDLFWGLRGGGGNFGVATSFEFQLHPVDPVMVGGELVYAWEDAPAVLKFFFESAPQMPDELNVDASLVRLPNDARFLTLDICYCGPRAQAERVLAPLRQIRKPTRDSVAATPYVQLQSSGDAGLAHGRRYYIKGGFVQKYSPGLLEVAIATISEAKLPVVQAVVFPQGGGAYKRVKPDSTAFAQRAADHNVFLFNSWEDPAFNDPVAAWVRANWAKVEPHTFGFYVNEFNADDAARLRDTYGANFDRLVALKTRYDPGNLFRLNANVAPKARS